jgi:hypothetical protein
MSEIMQGFDPSVSYLCCIVPHIDMLYLTLLVLQCAQNSDASGDAISRQSAGSPESLSSWGSLGTSSGIIDVCGNKQARQTTLRPQLRRPKDNIDDSFVATRFACRIIGGLEQDSAAAI